MAYEPKTEFNGNCSEQKGKNTLPPEVPCSNKTEGEYLNVFAWNNGGTLYQDRVKN